MNNNTWISFNDDAGSVEALQWLQPSAYTYPSQDFCIFADFPVERTIVLTIESYYLTVCTDTIAWLTQNYALYNVTTNQQFEPGARLVYSMCWERNNGSLKPNLTAIAIKVNNCIFKKHVS
jgi:hypothetical protein